MVLFGVLFACGGDGSTPVPDAAPDAANANPDALPLCVAPGDCPCFTNYDCPPTHACVSQDPSGTMVSCVAGPRGTGAAGTSCTGEQDCASALCVDDAIGGLQCSDVCESPATCPASLPRCIFLGDVGICARAP
ncbi:MAG: repeat domain protein [Deltaproteobacteria bacterium]|nr:repeat domain protein [Deltaproteobacteria bacterium]